MSRNFELLAQIEKELGADIPSNGSVENRAQSAHIPLPELSQSATDREFIRLIHYVFLPKNAKGYRQVVFCGVENENRSSSVIARVAQTLAANAPERVCLVDANPCSYGLSAFFGTSPEREQDAGQLAGRSGCVQLKRNLWLAPLQATTEGGMLLPVTQLRAKLAQLQRDFGFILIDSPECVTNADAIVLGQISDGVILVVKARETRRAMAAKAKLNFDAAGVQLVGTVLHGQTLPFPMSLDGTL
jgi:Mrp family chromosome partitioning ATPase